MRILIAALRRRYYRMLMSPLGRSLRTRKGRNAWEQFAPRVSASQEMLAQELQAQGIAYTSVRRLRGADTVLHAMQGRAAELKRVWDEDTHFREHILKGAEDLHLNKGAKKLFLIPLYGGGWVVPELDPVSPFSQWILSDELLMTAGAYLGSVPRLHSFNVSQTVVQDALIDATLSQRWHRDPEDARLVKVFLYLSDVADQGSGPFGYVRGSQEGGIYRRLFPQQYPAGSYPDKGEVERAVSAEAIVTCLGPAGTVIFCDTSGLHRGGLSTREPRLMLTASFVTDASLQPRKFSLPSPERFRGFSPLARAALYL